MKKIIFTICLITLMKLAIGQDCIIKKTGDEIKGKVTEITSTEIKYKKIDNPDVIYSILKSEVFLIKYENGTSEVINQLKTETTTNEKMKNIKNFNSRRKPALAGFLSFLYPGIGQFYNKQTLSGAIYMTCYTVEIALFLLSPMDEYYFVYNGYIYSAYSLTTTHYVALAAAGVNLILSVIDATVSASKINKEQGFTNLFDNDKFNIQLKPNYSYSFANNTADNIKSVPVFGAKLTLNIK